MPAAAAPPSLAQLVASAVAGLSQAAAAAKLVLTEQLETTGDLAGYHSGPGH